MKSHGPTWERQTRKDLKRIEQELSRPYDSPPAQLDVPMPHPSREAKAKMPLAVDIKMISGNGFLLDTRQPGVEIFSITLDGLDRMIEDRAQELDLQP